MYIPPATQPVPLAPAPRAFQAGAVKINYISYFFLTLTLVSPMYTYHVAVSKH